MANYSNIESMIAGIENATQLISDTKHDDDTYTIDGVDWFSYNGTVCNNIYANGNGWIGLGTSSEDLRVNRVDQAMYNLWREDGTYNSYRFLRIRWGGYTYYSYTHNEALLTFDVFLFDTGDIMLYVADVPTDNYVGDCSLGTVQFTRPTTSNRYVSFYKQQDGSYSIEYAAINLSSPYMTKYLVSDQDLLYTLIDGVYTQVAGELSASLFMEHGFDELPTGESLMDFVSPQVICWTNSEYVPELTATVQGSPTGSHDIVSDNIRVGHSSIYGITSVDTVASDGATFMLSFDGGEWMIYDASSSAWVVSDVGMSATELASVPVEAWSNVVNSANNMRLKAMIDGVDTVSLIKFNFNNESPIQQTSDS